jgi:hypothetical protein
MAEDYIHDVSRFTTAQTFFRANRTGTADAAAIKPEDIAKFNSIVFGPDLEETPILKAAPDAELLPLDANQADRISFTLKLLKYLPDL